VPMQTAALCARMRPRRQSRARVKPRTHVASPQKAPASGSMAPECRYPMSWAAARTLTSARRASARQSRKTKTPTKSSQPSLSLRGPSAHYRHYHPHHPPLRFRRRVSSTWGRVSTRRSRSRQHLPLAKQKSRARLAPRSMKKTASAVGAARAEATIAAAENPLKKPHLLAPSPMARAHPQPNLWCCLVAVGAHPPHRLVGPVAAHAASRPTPTLRRPLHRRLLSPRPPMPPLLRQATMPTPMRPLRPNAARCRRPSTRPMQH